MSIMGSLGSKFNREVEIFKPTTRCPSYSLNGFLLFDLLADTGNYCEAHRFAMTKKSFYKRFNENRFIVDQTIGHTLPETVNLYTLDDEDYLRKIPNLEFRDLSRQSLEMIVPYCCQDNPSCQFTNVIFTYEPLKILYENHQTFIQAYRQTKRAIVKPCYLTDTVRIMSKIYMNVLSLLDLIKSKPSCNRNREIVKVLEKLIIKNKLEGMKSCFGSYLNMLGIGQMVADLEYVCKKLQREMGIMFESREKCYLSEGKLFHLDLLVADLLVVSDSLKKSY